MPRGSGMGAGRNRRKFEAASGKSRWGLQPASIDYRESGLHPMGKSGCSPSSNLLK